MTLLSMSQKAFWSDNVTNYNLVTLNYLYDTTIHTQNYV